MTTPQKNSHADTVRQRRSPQKRSTPASSTRGLRTSSRTSAARQTTQTARQAYTPASLLTPGDPRPVAPTTLRKMRTSAVSAARESKGSAFGMNAQANARANVVSFPVPVRGSKARPGNRMVKNSRRNSYDSVISLGRTTVRAPAISLPRLGSRWASAVLTLLLGLMVYTMWTANTFKVSAAEVTGNQRLQSADVTQVLGLVGQPIFTVIPSKLEQDLRLAFPDLAKVSVQVAFPNHIRVAVVERTPILAWYQDGKTTWIDANGISFTPRGDVQGLVQIAANDAPPKPAVTPDLQKSINDQAFISPDMVQAILTLAPQIPAGSPMVFDPLYGMGWQDARGWSVYFGQTTQDIPMKLKVYQTILDTFSKQGIQPTLISLAYLDAPFYK